MPRDLVTVLFVSSAWWVRDLCPFTTSSLASESLLVQWTPKERVIYVLLMLPNLLKKKGSLVVCFARSSEFGRILRQYLT